MFAYADAKTGDILFGVNVPAGAYTIAENSSAVVLRAAVVSAGAHERQAMRNGEPVGEPVLCVPWFITSTDDAERAESVEIFASAVAVWIDVTERGGDALH